ncbi:MAG: hypothetical protein R6V04_10100 [bacterium]
MKLLIDYSVLCHTCWHMMKSPNYEAKTDIEAEEFARNLAGTLLYYKTRFQPEEITLAMDARGDYWRHAVMEKYYREHCLVSKYIKPFEETNQDINMDSVLEYSYVLSYDLKQYRIDYIDGPDKWVSKKLTKAEKNEIAALELIAVSYEEVPLAIKEFFPTYKGNRRTASWDYATTREEWYNLCAKISKNLAVTFGAKIIDVPLAEADDIAKVYADINTVQDMIFLTTDSDWSQMLSDHLFLKLFNPTKRDWVEITPEEANWKLAIKLMSGDNSDNIPAISLKSSAATLGPKAAEKLLLEYKLDGIYDYLEEHADHDALYRNYELIYLDNIDELVETHITKTIKVSKIPSSSKSYRLQQYGLDSKELIAIKAEAEEARNEDIENQLIAG